jgi:hypothetical protein
MSEIKSYPVKIVKGNKGSLRVTIPKELVISLGLDKFQWVSMTQNDIRQIIMAPAYMVSDGKIPIKGETE